MKTLDYYMAQDAKQSWLEAALENDIQIQEPEKLEDYSGQLKKPFRLQKKIYYEHLKG